jgi:hypothetical protein
MAAIVEARLLAVVLSQMIKGTRCQTVMHYGASAALVDGDAEALVNAWETGVLPVWQLAVSDEVDFEQIYCYCLDFDTIRTGIDQLNAIAGLIAGEALPNNTPALIQLRQTEVSGRHNGRLYISGVPESAADASLLSVAYQTGVLKDLADELLVTLNNGSGTNFNLVNVVRQVAGAPVTPSGYLVSASQAVRNLATQRRRTTKMQSFST